MSAEPKDQPSGKLWGGRFDRAPDEIFYQFQRSFSFDRRLLPYELAVDRVWAGALVSAGILSIEEMRDTLTALDKIADRAANEYAWLGGSPAGSPVTWSAPPVECRAPCRRSPAPRCG